MNHMRGLSAENYEHVIILKNGSEIHGIIIDQKPNDYVRILSGKDIFVFEVDDIALIKKVLVTDALKEYRQNVNHVVDI